MKKWILLIFIFIISCGTAVKNADNSAFSRNFDHTRNYRLAVFPVTSSGFLVEASTLQPIYDFVCLEILKTGRFSLIERKAIDAILQEQEFGISGIVDASTAARIGNVLGADAITLTQISRLKKDEFFESEDVYDSEVFIRFVDSSTGEILYYGKGCGKSFNGKLGAIQDAIKHSLKSLKGGIR